MCQYQVLASNLVYGYRLLYIGENPVDDTDSFFFPLIWAYKGSLDLNKAKKNQKWIFHRKLTVPAPMSSS